jgi:hypothetical protein
MTLGGGGGQQRRVVEGGVQNGGYFGAVFFVDLGNVSLSVNEGGGGTAWQVMVALSHTRTELSKAAEKSKWAF